MKSLVRQKRKMGTMTHFQSRAKLGLEPTKACLLRWPRAPPGYFMEASEGGGKIKICLETTPVSDLPVTGRGGP
jgi:hypothetical protein